MAAPAVVVAPTTPPSTRGGRVVASDVEVDRGGNRVLRGIDLDVAPGTTLALLGPSGCGKTTLLRAIAGLEPLRRGAIAVGERTLVDDDTDVPAERRHVGMVFQDWALFPHLSVARNVGFGLRADPAAPGRPTSPRWTRFLRHLVPPRDVSRAERRTDAVDRALALVDLAGLGDRMPATLSGGQQQRVAIARALATRPDVLLLDEPFSNLDAGLREQVRGEVATLLRELAITTILVTHDQEEAFLLGDRVAVMLDGRIHQVDTPATLYARPASREVAEFLGNANLVPASARGDRAETPLGPVPLASPRTGDVAALLRPEHLLVVPDAHGSARVEAVRYYGHDAMCRVSTEDGSEYDVRTLSAPGVVVGDRVTVRYAGPATVAY